MRIKVTNDFFQIDARTSDGATVDTLATFKDSEGQVWHAFEIGDVSEYPTGIHVICEGSRFFSRVPDPRTFKDGDRVTPTFEEHPFFGAVGTVYYSADGHLPESPRVKWDEPRSACGSVQFQTSIERDDTIQPVVTEGPKTNKGLTPDDRERLALFVETYGWERVIEMTIILAKLQKHHVSPQNMTIPEMVERMRELGAGIPAKPDMFADLMGDMARLTKALYRTR